MTTRNRGTSLRLGRAFVICAVFAMFIFTGERAAGQDASKPWVAPDDASKVKNPLPSNPENLTAGKGIYEDSCGVCHGEKGKGDGPGAMAIKVKPANFTDAKLMSADTDGSLFWKISEGRGPMQAWKDVLSEKERWQVIIYIRQLGKDAAK